MQPNDTSVNAPSAALAYTAFSTTFGNYNFMVTPPSPGKIGIGFPSIPYLSLEALLYSQAASNPAISPTGIMGGTSVSEQAMAGQATQRDATGTTRVSTGFSNSV